MAQYYNGTSAYELTFDEPIYTEQTQKNNTKQARIRACKQRLKMFAFIVAVFAVACTILYGNVIIIQTSSKVDDLQAQLAAITNENNQKMLNLERNIDLKKVEEIAINELGMKRPEKYQTVYVDVSQANYAEVNKEAMTGHPVTGSFGVIRRSLANLLAYFN